LLPELQHHLAAVVPADCPYVLHDLGHAGNTLAAATGASTRELIPRMGHSSMQAALIHQHATTDRDAAIAAALSELAKSGSPASTARVFQVFGT
jgi:hypothetical protein